MNRSSRCIRLVAALAAVAVTLPGCADSRLAANNAASGAPAQTSRETADYKAGYGTSSGGFTTDLYTELFGSKKVDDKKIDDTKVADREDQSTPPTTVSAASIEQNQPAPAPNAARQEPARQEAAAAENSHPTAYGIPSDGPTTDLYTALFGPRRRE